MSLSDYEIGGRFRLLDSDAVGDGQFASAKVLGDTSRATNWLVNKGEPLLSLDWRQGAPATSEALDGAVRGVPVSRWRRLHPGAWMRPKKHGLRAADLVVRATIPADVRLWIAVQTVRGPAPDRFAPGDPHVLELLGTGALATYILRDIPIDAGGRERFAFWVYGDPDLDGTVADATDYTNLGQATGQIFFLLNDGRVGANPVYTPRWNSGPGATTWARDHALVAHDGGAVGVIGAPVWWAQFSEVLSETEAMLWPPPRTDREANELRGRFFYIAQLPLYRVVHLSLWANDR